MFEILPLFNLLLLTLLMVLVVCLSHFVKVDRQAIARHEKRIVDLRREVFDLRQEAQAILADPERRRGTMK
ncbi:hypothetical protein [Aeromonas phage 32]|nr:hypothetical protein [Aeromonas phage 32]